MDMIVFFLGFAVSLAWLIGGAGVPLLDAVLRRRARARIRKAQRDMDVHERMDSQQPVGMDRHRILDDYFKGLR